VLALAVSPAFATDHTLLAATVEGMYRSQDRGQEWEEVPLAPEGEAVGELRALAAGVGEEGRPVFVAAAGTDLYRSDDLGRTWCKLKSPVTSMREEIIGLQLSPRFAEDRTILLGTFAPAGSGAKVNGGGEGARPTNQVAVWRSNDGGEHWSRVLVRSSTARWMTFALPEDFRGDSAGEAGSRFFVGAGTTIYRPMWQGKNVWMGERVGRPNTAVLSLVATPGGIWGRSIFAGTSDGVFRSDDEGLTWKALEAGMGRRTVVSVVLAPGYPEERTVFALTLGGLLWRWRES